MFLQNSSQKCRSSCLQMFFRSSCLEVFCKKDVLRNFPKFTGKHLCQSLFIYMVAGQGRQLYLKSDPGTAVSCDFCKISNNTSSYRTPLLTEHLWWLVLVLQNIYSRKFLNIHQKICLEVPF